MTPNMIAALVLVAPWLIWRLGGFAKGLSLPKFLNPKNWKLPKSDETPECCGNLAKEIAGLRAIAKRCPAVAPECEKIAMDLALHYWRCGE